MLLKYWLLKIRTIFLLTIMLFCFINVSMTNKENIESTDRISQKAIELAVHLVSQVLDEACIIVNTAKELGQPWWELTKTKKDSFLEFSKDNSSIIEMGDNDDVTIRQEYNAMATSTPQKITDEIKRNNKTDAFIIGQGDEENSSEQDALQEQSDLSKSTSTFINRLFDMSDVAYIHDEEDITQVINEINDSTIEEITNILTFCLECAFILAYKNNTVIDDDLNINIETSRSSEYSSYSFLDDAFSSNFVKSTEFYTDVDIATNSKLEVCKSKYAVFEDEANKNVIDSIQTKDVAIYENTYVTLNRDYDQYSDEEEFLSHDLKSLTLQDVELLCSKTSSSLLPANTKMEKRNLASTSVVPASSVSRKSSLVRRCRLQGARLFSCLRGWWWRRKLPGGHREPRAPGTVRGQCPLSPSVRLRASSLLDHRLIRTPSPSRPIVWKFNTINETMVNSAHWNEYAYQSTTERTDY